MRDAFLVLVLFDVGAICLVTAAQAPTEPKQPIAQTVSLDDGWRKTLNGWERKSDWQIESQSLQISYDFAKIHPLLVATLVVLLSVGVLIYFDAPNPSSRTRNS